ncbi:riboflavin biosynthesis pyrimidine reductase [Allocatelliglobosispora scoriae]|uniref:Riboflavin biosynthesis pyrimidine reductase n=1 Tax=Allocatelliglobosispora scoriae TaxID=643052 RepID=A0A841BXU9_9ACTN|nr:pyrimidine reductase family protein [Allocatelliglobosispora scoriae]MBB5872485.1 riboflavin biosynthesis pyrimidine reductase [Allocatelliglobosispora scoriae]
MTVVRPADELTDDELADLYPRTGGLRVNFVTSADGAIEVDGLSAGLSSEADKRVFRLLRMACDGLLVGAGTFRTEGYRPLTLDPARRAWRSARGLPAYPRLIVVSASLDLDPAHPALAHAPIRPLIVTSAPVRGVSERSEGAPQDAQIGTVPVEAATHPLTAVADLLPLGTPTGALDLQETVTALHALGLRELLCEGGARLLGALTAADLVDELCLTLSPVLAGPGSGRMTAGAAATPVAMRMIHLIPAGDMALLRYVRREDVASDR